jgi:hypothetical protein
MMYYYTDPLAAAWMAKHFGMRFNCFSFELIGLIDEFEPTTFVYVTPENIADACEQEIKAYIIPESLDILEPQPGDLMSVGKILYQCIPDIDSTVARSAEIKFLPQLEISRALHCHEKGKVRVLQRNGIVFMNPESEDAA